MLVVLLTFTQDYAKENKESTSELLTEFFLHYGMYFNARTDVVSVRSGKQQTPMVKMDKKESDGWELNDHLR